MASLSSSRRNSSSSSSTGRRSSRMDSLCEEDNSSVFSSNGGSSPHSRATSSTLAAPTNNGDLIAGRIRSPSLPVVSHPSQSCSSTPGIARSRSPSLPASGPDVSVSPERSVDGLSASQSGTSTPRRAYYADRSDSGISDCSNHSSMLLSGSYMPALIQEEEDENCTEMSGNFNLTNGSTAVHLTGGTSLASKSNCVVRSRHSVDSAIGE